MDAIKAFLTGFKTGRRDLMAALVLWFATWLFGSLALVPMSRAFHLVLDQSPAARDFTQGQGFDLVAEMDMAQPGLFPAAFAPLQPFLLLFFFVGLFLIAGVTALAADPGVGFVRGMTSGGRKNFLPFLALFGLNLLFLAACAVVAGLIIALVQLSVGEPTDPGPGWRAFLASLAIGGFFLHLWRNSVGYGQALYALRGGEMGITRSFLKGAAFSLRHFIPVNLMTWGVNALRAAVLLGLFLSFGPGYATGGRWFLSVLQFQACVFLMVYLRVAEVKMQVDFARRKAPAPVVAEKTAPPDGVVGGPSGPMEAAPPDEAEGGPSGPMGDRA